MIRAVVVDDEAPARHRMRYLLQNTDCCVVGEADRGDSAVAQIERLKPDVVFLDIQMPVFSGLDVASRLSPPRPRIIFCTAFDQFAIKAFEQQAVDYLLKPVNRDRLARALDRIRAGIRDQRAVEEAARTQAQLMPPAHSFGALECAAVCRPAEGVGGDYYDILPAGDGRVALVVADVSGKGIYAGILAAALQARLQAIAERGCADPGAVLTEVNRMTAGSMEAHRFATLFLAVFDPKTSSVRYASAGHPPALVISRDGGHRRLEAAGPAIGWGDASFPSETIAVRPGDLIAIYSDGVTETLAPDGTDLGVDGLIAAICRHAALTVDDLARAVLADVDRFSGGAAPGDDRTLLVARVA